MEDTDKLLAIKKELEQISQRIDNVFPQEHPLYDATFEDIGTATYYIREVCYLIESAIKTVKENEGTDHEHS